MNGLPRLRSRCIEQPVVRRDQTPQRIIGSSRLETDRMALHLDLRLDKTGEAASLIEDQVRAVIYGVSVLTALENTLPVERPAHGERPLRFGHFQAS